MQQLTNTSYNYLTYNNSKLDLISNKSYKLLHLHKIHFEKSNYYWIEINKNGIGCEWTFPV